MSWGDEPPPSDKVPPGKWGEPSFDPDRSAPIGPPRLSVLSQAWRAYTSRLGSWVVAMLLVMAGYSVVMWLASWIVGDDFVLVVRRGLQFIAPSPGKSLLYAAAASVINGCVMGGLMRMAVRQCRGLPFSAVDVLNIGDIVGPLVRVSLLYSALVGLGTFFCLIPGLFASALLMFATPLVVEGERSAIQALRRSAALLRGQAISATIVHTILALVLSLGGGCCFVGLLVTGPLYVLSVAILYTERTTGLPPLPPGAGPGKEPVTYL